MIIAAPLSGMYAYSSPSRRFFFYELMIFSVPERLTISSVGFLHKNYYFTIYSTYDVNYISFFS